MQLLEGVGSSNPGGVVGACKLMAAGARPASAPGAESSELSLSKLILCCCGCCGRFLDLDRSRTGWCGRFLDLDRPRPWPSSGRCRCCPGNSLARFRAANAMALFLALKALVSWCDGNACQLDDAVLAQVPCCSGSSRVVVLLPCCPELLT